MQKKNLRSFYSAKGECLQHLVRLCKITTSQKNYIWITNNERSCYGKYSTSCHSKSSSFSMPISFYIYILQNNKEYHTYLSAYDYRREGMINQLDQKLDSERLSLSDFYLLDLVVLHLHPSDACILLSQPYNPAGVKSLLCSHLVLDHLMYLLPSCFIVAQFWSATQALPVQTPQILLAHCATAMTQPG